MGLRVTSKGLAANFGRLTNIFRVGEGGLADATRRGGPKRIVFGGVVGLDILLEVSSPLFVGCNSGKNCMAAFRTCLVVILLFVCAGGIFGCGLG